METQSCIAFPLFLTVCLPAAFLIMVTKKAAATQQLPAWNVGLHLTNWEPPFRKYINAFDTYIKFDGIIISFVT